MEKITQVRDQVVDTVGPVLNKAIEKTTPVLTTAISGAIGVVERMDPDATNREAVYGSAPKQTEESSAAADAAPAEESKAAAADSQVAVDQTSLQKLKVVTGDLIDLWLYEGSKGLRYIQASKAYQLTDPYVHYVEKYEAVKSKSQKILESLEQVPKKIVLFYDEATSFVGMLITVLGDRQEELVAYVRRTYDNVQVFMKDNYLRLDFNQDGSVSMEDLRASLLQFYEFLKSYDYIEATTRIKSSLYDQAVGYMKRDQEAASQKESAVEGDAGDEPATTQVAEREQPLATAAGQPSDDLDEAEVRESEQKAAQEKPAASESKDELLAAKQ